MKTIDADEILAQATPTTHQQGHEIQPFNHLVKMPIALAHATCAESVENLNRLLADTISLRDLYKKLVPGGPGMVGSRVILRLLAAGREVRTMLGSPTRVAETRAILDIANVQPSARVWFSTADRDHDAGRLDAVAGSGVRR